MIREMTIALYYPEYSGVFHPDLCESWWFSREDHCGGYPVYSGLLICPICLKTWARLTLDGIDFHEARTAPCQAHSAACHPDLRPVAGSLLDNPTINGYDSVMLDVLPEQLLRREFDLHLKAKWDD